MTFKMSEKAQTLKVYNLRADTQEFIGAGDAFIPPHTGLPANCTDIAPPDIPAAHVAVFDPDKAKWSLAEDHRGRTIFDTGTGREIYVTVPGPLPDNTTSLAPDGQYQKWDGRKWVKDDEAEKAARLRDAENQKSRLMQTANVNIAPLQDAVDLDIATDQEKRLLTDWKKYRVSLNRVDTSIPLDIEWPQTPSN
ncbi:phage tail protein [Erwinia sp. OLTSP20]|uniref:tail fiber assembly protein n=1 Tax=unclassified Erwinia TaxID=2622719 RepID=UPI000C188C02|nr:MULTISPECIES: tail fiber assembly protein [unclassified Erwinia]PIJ48974.1 phage tail protein [Erwinia sp. OAMSP11]PIJ74627.1 phage tail protein [Erwinia sp. OLSSP12]PIJ79658.1 phage tail protein [Erwinia sp. OLCASP19]PIJ80443.1 phage tail protein [Erwinia sp. OLMTSP26]PIJ82558.1 phage tail protein [Erwinia sp. OLMDSP33]